jgi:hypothetical protein
MGAVISPEGDVDLGGEDTENVTQVATENVMRVEQNTKVGTQKGASEDILLGAKTQKLRALLLLPLISMNLMMGFMTRRPNMIVPLVFLSLLLM